MLKFLESVEHKPGWYPFENGHAQVSYRAKALRTPDPYYDRTFNSQEERSMVVVGDES